ncbi:MAG: Fur family transcriptional regulator [Candidatus Microsaccharimonas sp.]
MNSELVSIFSQLGLRLTSPRVVIFTTLKDSPTPLSITQIITLCPEIDKVSVYRTIKLFTSLNIVATITNGWKYSYELSSPFQPHHHHIVCVKCAKVGELQSEIVESLVHKLAKQHSFRPTFHHFEIQGICKDCQNIVNLPTEK